ncbi:MAG: hypothetical protein ACYSUY_15935 [Planctomycetota bacterium]|jgi:probable HAF family extracellular repeat protein
MKKSCGDKMKMTRRHLFVLAVAFLLSHFLSISFGAGASFQGLGVPGGSIFSGAFDVSTDGSIVVGFSAFASGNREAFRWTSSGGLKGLGDLPGGSNYDFFSEAWGVTGDGSVVVGLSEGASGYEAFRWTESAGMVGLGTLGGANFFSQAEAISHDGTVIVGHSDGLSGREAFRWTESGGMVGLGDLPGGPFQSKANDISLDGSIVVGEGSSAVGGEPVLWTAEGDIVALGLLPGVGIGDTDSVSGNGAAAVGMYIFESVWEPFLWTESGGMQKLGTNWQPFGVSDGSVVVGSGQLGSGSEAIIWDEIRGAQSLKYVLQNGFGLDLSGWALGCATAISPDGSTIVGYGANPQGYTEAWIATVPIPVTIIVDADANGANDGSNWADAYNYLQDALAIARYGDEIRTAKGTYTPDSNSTDPNGSGDRKATFKLISGVTIKGGYAGFGEPDPDARDIQLYETILSGDLAGNDRDVNELSELLSDPCRAENSYHVVTGSGTNQHAVLDGLTITAGNANSGYYPNYAGGGMSNINGSPTISNCTFTGNSGLWGAGVYNYEYSNPTLINCTFSGNFATWAGGGMQNDHQCSPSLTNCLFIGNLASDGGGIYNIGGSSTLTNCAFRGNSVKYFAGGMRAGYYSTLTNCEFSDNSAGYKGGGLHVAFGNPTLTNCTFSNNVAGSGAGGILVDECSPTLTNCTFSGNSASLGGGMENMFESNPTLINCILWGDEPNEIVDSLLSSTTVTYSDVQGGWPGIGNIDADPCFADANNGDCHLKSQAGRWEPNSQTWIKDTVSSPCIDAGDLASDWRAELWPHGERINIGAYGGTPEASMSLWDAGNIADLNIDGEVDYRDMKLLIDKWPYQAVLLPEDLNRDGIVNFIDYAIFTRILGLLGPARHPNPGDGARVVSRTADLSWTADPDATSHDVYFGTSSRPPFIQNQAATTFDPDTMAYSTTYYWRIDEVGAYGTSTGVVWSFTTTGPGPG